MKKIFCAIMASVITANMCAAFACTPTIKIDMSWKKDMDKALSNIHVTVPDITIPSSYFDNINFN